MARSKSPALSINDALPPDVLTEVFIRVPAIDLFRCKSVCKLWLSCIDNDRGLVPRFILHRIRKPSPDDDDDQQLITLRWNHCEILMFTPTSYCQSVSDLSLDFLPFFRGLDPFEERLSLTVVGFSNGLFLCTSYVTFVGRYFICNPVTKHWLELPRFPLRPHGRYAHVGFFNDPFYLVYDSVAVNVNHQSGWKVVCVDFSIRNEEDENDDEVEVDTFSSHTGSWSVARIRLPDHVIGEVEPESMVTLDGRLYWLLDNCELLIYDANSNEFLPDRVSPPSGLNVLPFRVLSQCRGSLWVAESLGSILRVHSLVNGEWKLEHEFDLLRDMQCSLNPARWTQGWQPDAIDFTAMHFRDPTVAYVAVESMLFECDFGRRTLTAMIDDALELERDLDDIPVWLGKHFFTVLQVPLPLWPAPLPLLPNA